MALRLRFARLLMRRACVSLLALNRGVGAMLLASLCGPSLAIFRTLKRLLALFLLTIVSGSRRLLLNGRWAFGGTLSICLAAQINRERPPLNALGAVALLRRAFGGGRPRAWVAIFGGPGIPLGPWGRLLI